MESSTFYEDPLEIIERSLRDVIHDVLSLKYGPTWHQDAKIGLGPKWVKRLEAKEKGDEGILKPEIVYDLPLAYAEFSELSKLLEKHMELFTPIFKNWVTFLAYYHTAEKLRNIVKHHRDLSPTQYQLLAGIAGEFETAINFWRVGSGLEVKRKIFQFTDLVPIEEKSDEEILANSSSRMGEWKVRLADAAKRSSLNPKEFNPTESEFEYTLQGPHISVRIYTSSNPSESHRINEKPFKGIYGELIENSGCRINLDEFLKAVGKPYFHIAYDLAETINVEALSKWSLERAGLNPASSGSYNQELTDVEYSLLGGKIRVGAWKYAESIGREGGRLFATTGSQEGFWRAHIFLDPKKLLGFMVGSITPKAMMHLVRLSQIPMQNSKS